MDGLGPKPAGSRRGGYFWAAWKLWIAGMQPAHHWAAASPLQTSDRTGILERIQPLPLEVHAFQILLGATVLWGSWL